MKKTGLSKIQICTLIVMVSVNFRTDLFVVSIAFFEVTINYFKTRQHDIKKHRSYGAFRTGDERIELPPKVLETPIIPFDQSPKFIKMTYKIRHLLYIILVKLTSTFYL